MREYIARGIIVSGNDILLCLNKEMEYYYLPGGHIDEGENSEAALHREIMEEAGQKVERSQFVQTIENSYEQNGAQIDEKFDVYLIDLDDPRSVQCREDHIDLNWKPIEMLTEIDMRPAWIVPDILTRINEHKEFWSNH